VADGAVLFLDRVSAMTLFETVGIALMAGNAQFSGFSGEQIFFFRCMGVVTTQAAFVLDYLVNDFPVVSFFFMTLKADRIPASFQEICFVGGMRIVAGNASAFSHGGMDILLVHIQVFNLVAGEAEFIPLFLENKLCHHAMPEMAVFALLLRNHLVDILSGKVLLRKVRMAVQAALLGKSPFFLGFRIFTESKDDQAAADKDHSPNG
jgi:hypothetical protein